MHQGSIFVVGFNAYRIMPAIREIRNENGIKQCGDCGSGLRFYQRCKKRLQGKLLAAALLCIMIQAQSSR